MFSSKKLVEEVDRQYRDDPKQGYSGPVPIISYDKNCINARQGIDAMNELELLSNEGWIFLQKSHVLMEEPEKDKDRISKACKTVAVGGEGLTPSEQAHLIELCNLLFSEKTTLSVRDERDVRHIFDHQKYSGNHEWNFFVTEDRKHILSKHLQLAQMGINVGNPEACLLWLESILPKLKDRIRRHHLRDKSHRAGGAL